MATLSYDEKKIVTVFKRFFGNRYDTHIKESVHIKTQMMCYLLKVAGVEIGNFNYSWNFRGPFSSGLLALLRSIDRKNKDVAAFYEQTVNQDKLLSGNENKIDDIRKKLEIDKHQEDSTEWIELLGSLTYITRSVHPGADFEIINQRLIQENQKYSNRDVNYQAWEILDIANFLTM